MTPPERLESTTLSDFHYLYPATPQPEMDDFDPEPPLRPFSESFQVIVLLVIAVLLGYFFIRFLEQDVARALHHTNRTIHIEPAGY